MFFGLNPNHGSTQIESSHLQKYDEPVAKQKTRRQKYDERVAKLRRQKELSQLRKEDMGTHKSHLISLQELKKETRLPHRDVSARGKPARLPQSAPDDDELSTWVCASCTFSNSFEAEQCEVCQQTPPDAHVRSLHDTVLDVLYSHADLWASRKVKCPLCSALCDQAALAVHVDLCLGFEGREVDESEVTDAAMMLGDSDLAAAVCSSSALPNSAAASSSTLPNSAIATAIPIPSKSASWHQPLSEESDASSGPVAAITSTEITDTHSAAVDYDSDDSNYIA